MNKYNVSTPEHALAYLADCTMATIESMAMKKSRSRYEYSRQISIAQQSLDWMKRMGVDYSTTRMSVAQEFESIRDWAMSFEVKK